MGELNTWPGWTCVRQIGAGSYGKVFEIEREESGQIHKAALKVMSVPSEPDAIQDVFDLGVVSTEQEAENYIEDQIQRLAQEVQLMAELKGTANIVWYEDHKIIPHQGWMGADILIRMELLTPLNRYMRSHAMEEPDIIRLGIDICRALEACQQMDPPIIHRDIKPANIMVDESGQFKLGDFGIARMMEGTKSAHTQAGTLSYMAPEVWLGKGYFVTADIYSLGVVLYRLLNNNRAPFLPYEGAVTEKMQQDAQNDRLQGADVPEPRDGSPMLKKTVCKALEYDPQRRFQTAKAFEIALQKCAQEESTDKTVYLNLHGAEAEATVVGTVEETEVLPKPEKVYKDKKSKKGLVMACVTGCVVLLLLVGIGSLMARRHKKTAEVQQNETVSVSSGKVVSDGGENQSVSDIVNEKSASEVQETSSVAELPQTVTTLEIVPYTDVIVVGDQISPRVKADSFLMFGYADGLTWSVDDTSIAEVSKQGKVTAKAPGTCQLQVTYGDHSAVCTLQVVKVDTADNISIKTDYDSLMAENYGDVEVQVSFDGITADTAKDYSVSAYYSAGVQMDLTWGDVNSDGDSLVTTLAMKNINFYVDSDAYITIYVEKTDEPGHIVAVKKVKVSVQFSF